jgi:hypothetical protein
MSKVVVEGGDRAPHTAIIGVIGSDDHPGEPIAEEALATAREVGRLIATAGAVLVSGGRGGIMREASRGAFEAGGIVIGLLPSLDRGEANEFVTIPLATGFAGVRNHLTVRAADAVIMIAGSTGTLNEATITYARKPLVVIEGTGGWSDRLRSILYDGTSFDVRLTASVTFVNTAGAAVQAALEARPLRQDFSGD